MADERLATISRGVQITAPLITAQASDDHQTIQALLEDADPWTTATLLAVFHNTVVEMSRGNKHRYRRAMRRAAASVQDQAVQVEMQYLTMDESGDLPEEKPDA